MWTVASTQRFVLCCLERYRTRRREMVAERYGKRKR